MELADNVVGVNPVKSLLVSEEVNLQVIALPSETDCVNKEPVPLLIVALASAVV